MLGRLDESLQGMGRQHERVKLHAPPVLNVYAGASRNVVSYRGTYILSIDIFKGGE